MYVCARAAGKAESSRSQPNQRESSPAGRKGYLVSAGKIQAFKSSPNRVMVAHLDSMIHVRRQAVGSVPS